MPRKILDKGIEGIIDEVLTISKITSETVDLAIKSLKNRDLELYSTVVKKEEESDILNLKIDDDCFRITALQQPVAKDLRCIATMIKISDNYERICDLSLKIAEMTLKYEEKPLLKPLIDIPRMGGAIQEMIKINDIAIKNWKPMEIKSLQEKEDYIDNLYNEIYRELLTFMMKDPNTIDDATDLLFTARYLERMADIAAKTGARIYWTITGERIWIK
jgi:phosphate transport system protein|tara:strand:- start:1315 stop:1968 length:654 start_codon:yes stop_codon:yes gene_type:complete